MGRPGASADHPRRVHIPKPAWVERMAARLGLQSTLRPSDPVRKKEEKA